MEPARSVIYIYIYSSYFKKEASWEGPSSYLLAATKEGAMVGMQLPNSEVFRTGSNMATQPNDTRYMEVRPGIW